MFLTIRCGRCLNLNKVKNSVFQLYLSHLKNTVDTHSQHYRHFCLHREVPVHRIKPNCARLWCYNHTGYRGSCLTDSSRVLYAILLLLHYGSQSKDHGTSGVVLEDWLWLMLRSTIAQDPTHVEEKSSPPQASRDLQSPQQQCK